MKHEACEGMNRRSNRDRRRLCRPVSAVVIEHPVSAVSKSFADIRLLNGELHLTVKAAGQQEQSVGSQLSQSSGSVESGESLTLIEEGK